MKILSLLTPNDSFNRNIAQSLSIAEEKRVWELFSQGTLREMYFQPDPVRVLLIWEADSFPAVGDVIQTFPMVQAGLFTIELVEMGYWRPMEVLFGEQS